MTRTIRFPSRFLFAAAMAGALTFGATQAFATPQAAESRFCDNDWCAERCGGLGYCYGATCACY